MHYEHRIVLGMSSVDRAGVLFYPELFRHAHDVYEAFMASIGADLTAMLDAPGHVLPVVHAEADYYLPMRHGQIYTVRVSVADIGETSFAVHCDFLGPNGRLYSQVRSTQVCLNTRDGAPRALPYELRAKLTRCKAQQGRIQA
jgi:acyl-CoA thioesterase FadM